MDWQTIVNWVIAAQLPVILGLVALDILLGVAKAIKANAFAWKKLGQFYRTMVAPYVVTYLALYVLVDLVPQVGGIVGDGLVSAAFGTIVYNLVQSIWANLKALGLRNG